MMANISTNHEPAQSPEMAKLLDRVKELLDSSQPQAALKLLAREDSQWARHARAVCYLRLGDAHAAVNILRGLVVTQHLNLRPEAPLVFKTNFAAALLLTGNIGGGVAILDEIRDEQHPAVQRLRVAVQQWKASMSLWQKVRWWLGEESVRPFAFDYPPGDF